MESFTVISKVFVFFAITIYTHLKIRITLKLNVLIDDAENGVLCDFGLSRVKADVTSRTANIDDSEIIGSRNWMAPEQLLGGSLKKPSDLYAFGMTVYEVSIVQDVL